MGKINAAIFAANKQEEFDLCQLLKEIEDINLVMKIHQREELDRVCDSEGVDLILLPSMVFKVRERWQSERKKEKILYPLPPKTSAVRESSLEIQVTTLLYEIGIPANIKGFHFLRQAIILAVEDMDILSGVTKQLYPAIAKQFHTTPSRVERAIRHAIEVCWTKGNLEILQGLFENTISIQKGKPTNSEFIALLADKMRMNYKNKAFS